MEELSNVSEGIKNQEVFAYIKAIAEYIVRHKIRNLLLIDTGARPLYVWVKEYLKPQHPDVNKNLNIYFINPSRYTHYSSQFPQRQRLLAKLPEFVRLLTLEQNAISLEKTPFNDLLSDFQDSYPQLIKQKDEPTLIFDTCIHTGVAMEWFLKVIKKIEFSDLKIGVVDDNTNSSWVFSNFIVDYDPKTCYSFGKETLVKKNNWVMSVKNPNKDDIEKWKALRLTIKRLVQEHLKDG